VKDALGKPGAHEAAKDDCLNCHTPHAADEKGLVRGSERERCLDCHDDVKKHMDGSRSIHPLRANGGRCTSCHRPHQSDQPKLLAAAKVDLCATCHKTHAKFTHPFGKGVVDPRTKQEMTCLSCHGPHGTAQRNILVADGKRDLCVRCHGARDDGTMRVGGAAKGAHR
jgi:predicted CXXCH cytochrome family protein